MSNIRVLISDVPTMTGPGALTLSRGNFARLENHFRTLLEQLRQLPATPTDPEVRQRFSNLLLLPRALALALRTLDTTAGLPATLALAITDLRADTDLRAAVSGLIAYEKNAGVMSVRW